MRRTALSKLGIATGLAAAAAVISLSSAASAFADTPTPEHTVHNGYCTWIYDPLAHVWYCA